MDKQEIKTQIQGINEIQDANERLRQLFLLFDKIQEDVLFAVEEQEMLDKASSMSSGFGDI